MENSFESLMENAKTISESRYAKQLLENIESNAESETLWENISEIIKNIEIRPFLLPEWTGVTLGVLALALIIDILKGSFKSSVVYSTIVYIVRLLLAATFIIPISNIITDTCGYMQETVAFLGVLTPTVGVIAAAGGNIAAAKTANIFLTLLLACCQVLLNKILPLVCSLFFGIAVLDAVNHEGRMLVLSQTVRNVCYTAFSIFTALFCIVLSTQSLAASGTDSFSARAVRLAVGNAIPIVGGTLGEALKLVGGSIVSVKNAVGTAAVVFLLAMYIPPLLILWGNGILINVYIFLCDYFALTGVKSLFIHMKHAVGFVLAAFTCLFVMGMINIGIFMSMIPAISS